MRSEDKQRRLDKRVPRARKLRREVTTAERRLWWHLKRLPLENSHFRRQAIIGPFFVDFACHDKRLVIDLDGGQHNETAQFVLDECRTSYLQTHGYRVLRFWNNEVLNEIEGVLEVIATNIAAIESASSPHPRPLPTATRGEGSNSPHAKRRVSHA